MCSYVMRFFKKPKSWGINVVDTHTHKRRAAMHHAGMTPAYELLGFDVGSKGVPMVPPERNDIDRRFRKKLRDLMRRYPPQCPRSARDELVGRLEKVDDEIKIEIGKAFQKLQDARDTLLGSLDSDAVQRRDAVWPHNDDRWMPFYSHSISSKDVLSGQHVYRYAYGFLCQRQAIVSYVPQGECRGTLETELKRQIRVLQFMPNGIEEASLAAFLQGACLRRAQYAENYLDAMFKWGVSYRDWPCDTNITLRRVERLKRAAEDRPMTYHVLLRNCESLALWCMTGKLWSRQVQRAGVLVVAGGGGGALLGAGASCFMLASAISIEFEVCGTVLAAAFSAAAAQPAAVALLGISLAVFMLAGGATALFQRLKRSKLKRAGIEDRLAFIRMLEHVDAETCSMIRQASDPV